MNINMEQEYKEIICALKHSEIPLDIQKILINLEWMKNILKGDEDAEQN